MREFNVTGSCNKREHYMVDISNKLEKIKVLVDKGKYFTINRARQYGKTTTIEFLTERLKEEYIVLRTTFEGLSDVIFESDMNFNKNFIDTITQILERQKIENDIIEKWKDKEDCSTLKLLGDKITSLCEIVTKPVVLIVDEVDKSSNHKLFLDFLGMLRAKYLMRHTEPTFYSVILAGVHDIKTIRYSGSNQNSKNNSFDDNARKIDSPWNIAADFDIDMSFNPVEISSMLCEYEDDHHTVMDIIEISNEIYKYTSGYPFLVSRICQKIDEKLNKNWTIEGVGGAVKLILKEDNTLFDDMFKNIENTSELKNIVTNILIGGRRYGFDSANFAIKMGLTYGILKDEDNVVKISNSIFETRIYNYLISVRETSKKAIPVGRFIDDVVEDGKLNIETMMQKFAQFMKQEYRKDDERFKEVNGRLLFLSFLIPIINGVGFYFVDPKTRNDKRMDIILTYGNEKFVFELKIWYGDKKHELAYKQLADYLSIQGMNTGYLLTFDFRESKEMKHEWIEFEDKKILDVIV